MNRRCRICNRPLTDSKSISLGIGPICLKKYNDYTQIGFDFEESHHVNQITKIITSSVNDQEYIMSYGEDVKIELFTDGSSSPRRSGWGFVIKAIKNGVTLKELEKSGEIPHTTNNRAEIQAVIEGLKILVFRSDVTVYSDSKYVVSTMNDNWKRKTNYDLWFELDKLCRSHDVTFKWIPRDQNRQADALSR